MDGFTDRVDGWAGMGVLSGWVYLPGGWVGGSGCTEWMGGWEWV